MARSTAGSRNLACAETTSALAPPNVWAMDGAQQPASWSRHRGTSRAAPPRPPADRLDERPRRCPGCPRRRFAAARMSLRAFAVAGPRRAGGAWTQLPTKQAGTAGPWQPFDQAKQGRRRRPGLRQQATRPSVAAPAARGLRVGMRDDRRTAARWRLLTRYSRSGSAKMVAACDTLAPDHRLIPETPPPVTSRAPRRRCTAAINVPTTQPIP